MIKLKSHKLGKKPKKNWANLLNIDKDLKLATLYILDPG